MCEVLVVQDGVEHESVSSDGLTAIDRIVGEQQHISLTQVRIHHYGMLGNRRSFVEQAIEQERLGFGESQDDFRPFLNRDHLRIVARLFLIQRLWLPWLLLYERLGLGDLSSQRLIAVVDAAAAGCPLRVWIQGIRQRVHQNAASAASERIADVERHAVGADGPSLSVALVTYAAAMTASSLPLLPGCRGQRKPC